MKQVVSFRHRTQNVHVYMFALLLECSYRLIALLLFVVKTMSTTLTNAVPQVEYTRTFFIFSHMWSSGAGNGSGVLVAFNLARLHTLSHARTTLGLLWIPVFSTRDKGHCRSMFNTWEGDSDLEIKSGDVCKTYFRWHVKNYIQVTCDKLII